MQDIIGSGVLRGKTTTTVNPEEILSDYYPVGLYKATVKGIKKGNVAVILAQVKKGEGLETATQIYLYSFYVDENNMLTLVTNDEAMFLIKNKYKRSQML